jgi:hypothetical protein
MKIVYWIVVACDVAGFLLLVLALAAAPGSKTSPLAVAATMLVIPGLLPGGSILLFLRAASPVWRLAKLLVGFRFERRPGLLPRRTHARHRDGEFLEWTPPPWNRSRRTSM